MAELIITHRIEAPELVAAMNNLSDALRGGLTATVAAVPAEAPAEVQNTAPPASAPQPVETPEAAPAPIPEAVPAPVETPAPAPVSAPAPVQAPVEAPAPAPAAPRQYSFEDVTKGGSQLMDMNKMAELMGLLKEHGVQAVTQLKPEQYASVCEGLMKLGAKI